MNYRVNFLKYKKPEKDLSNLDRSETFKIIHQKEREPRHGIQVRPPMVLCEEEVRMVIHLNMLTMKKSSICYICYSDQRQCHGYRRPQPRKMYQPTKTLFDLYYV